MSLDRAGVPGEVPISGDHSRIRALSLAQFFAGGFVLFIAAVLILIETAQNSYDGGSSAIGWALTAVTFALVSMIVAFAIGAPLRLMPALRKSWLANGEVTLAGAVIGAAICWFVVTTSPVVELTAGEETFRTHVPNAWALAAGWILFAFSVAHFVWPARWKRRSRR